MSRLQRLKHDNSLEDRETEEPPNPVRGEAVGARRPGERSVDTIKAMFLNLLHPPSLGEPPHGQGAKIDDAGEAVGAFAIPGSLSAQPPPPSREGAMSIKVGRISDARTARNSNIGRMRVCTCVYMHIHYDILGFELGMYSVLRHSQFQGRGCSK